MHYSIRICSNIFVPVKNKKVTLRLFVWIAKIDTQNASKLTKKPSWNRPRVIGLPRCSMRLSTSFGWYRSWLYRWKLLETPFLMPNQGDNKRFPCCFDWISLRIPLHKVHETVSELPGKRIISYNASLQTTPSPHQSGRTVFSNMLFKAVSKPILDGIGFLNFVIQTKF